MSEATQSSTKQNQPETAVAAALNPPLSQGLLRVILLYAIVISISCLVAWQVWGGSVALVGLLSGAVCLIAAIAAHYLSQVPRGDVFILARLYMSSGVRIGLPVVLLVVCKMGYPELFNRGMVYFVILFYLVGLSNDLMTQVARLNQLKAASAEGGPESNLANPASGNS